MTRPLTTTVLALLLVLLGAAAATAAPVYVGHLLFSAAQEASIMMSPDGSGPPLTEARSSGGAVIDASIDVQLVDFLFDPILNFPREDLWLQFADDGTVGSCFQGGLIFPADDDTDLNGWTRFALPPRGGGWSAGPATVYLNGSPAYDPGGLVYPSVPLRANSPDLNGDLAVDLSDIALFTQDLFSGDTYRSDLNWDGQINIVDIALFVGHIGVVCE
ncbi:MAG: hypothetical protein R3D98_04750 [Candidatus Krumholzibacteriia bacterium]